LAEYEAKQNGDSESVAVTPEKVSVKDAVTRFLNSKRNENLAEATIEKLKTIFEKQFLSWATTSRLNHLEDIRTADLEAFRDTWEVLLASSQLSMHAQQDGLRYT
jgi:hypothetical protein